MSETLHAFWYRPLWQQTLPLLALLGLLILVGYLTYWKESSSQLLELEHETAHLLKLIQKDEHVIQQSLSINQLTQQIQDIEQSSMPKRHSVALFSHLNALVSESRITLNKLQPMGHNEGYAMEVQGSFANIYHFIHQLISSPSSYAWHYSEITLSLRKNVLIASMTLSSMFHLATIKDENSYE